MEQALKPRSLAFAILLGALLLVLAGSAWFSAPQTTSAAVGSGPITGYAWSDNIGWISLNCATGSATGGSVCSTSDYKLTLNTNGTVTGYAWSANIGWIQFGGLSSIPGSTGGQARINPAGDQLYGWARACAGTTSGDCSSMTSRTDGWDGWISLNCTTTAGGCTESSYGVQILNDAFRVCNATTGSCAWGSDVVGWLDFQYATLPSLATYTLTVSKAGTAGSVTGAVGTTNISCSTANCQYTLNEGDYGSLNANIAGGSTDFVWSGDLCSGTTSNPCNVPALTGNKTVTATFNTTTSPPTGCLSTAASPNCVHSTTVRKGNTTTLYWWTTDTASCTRAGNPSGSVSINTGTSLNGSGATSAVNQKTIYTLTCQGDDGSTFTDTATINLVPTFQEI